MIGVGDKVVVVATKYPDQHGNEGVVSNITSGSHPYHVAFLHGTPGGSFNVYQAVDLQLIPKETSMNVLNQAEYTISKNDLKFAVEALRDHKKISAIKLLRAVAGCTLIDAKNYVEGDMKDTYAVGALVRLSYCSPGRVVALHTNPRGLLTYLVQDSDGDAVLKTQEDILGLAA